MKTLQQNSCTTQFSRGTARIKCDTSLGYDTGATLKLPMREILSEVHNGHHVQKKNKEEPHGRHTPELVPLQFIDNGKFYLRKLTQLY